jgi:hypothetical protein
MTDIASDLRARFDFAVLWFHEKCELDPNSLLGDEHNIVDLTDGEARAVKIFETLALTILNVLRGIAQSDPEYRT